MEALNSPQAYHLMPIVSLILQDRVDLSIEDFADPQDRNPISLIERILPMHLDNVGALEELREQYSFGLGHSLLILILCKLVPPIFFDNSCFEWESFSQYLLYLFHHGDGA